MFGVILHPQPVGRRRAVPELIVHGAQLEPIGPGHVLVVQKSLARRAESSPVVQSLEFVVDYRLSEYLRILRDYAPVEHLRRARLKGKAKATKLAAAPWHFKVLLYLFGSLAFSYKVRRVGPCRFVIDSRGIKRVSKGGAVESPWEKVTGVLELSEAYLVQKAEGAMPIPFRSMSTRQRIQFERLASTKLRVAGSGP